MMTYAFMWSSFESFSLDLATQDVKNDGYYSKAGKVICDYGIALYKNGKYYGNQKLYQAALQTNKTYIENPVRILAF